MKKLQVNISVQFLLFHEHIDTEMKLERQNQPIKEMTFHSTKKKTIF